MGESAAAGLVMAVAQEMVKRNEIHLIKMLFPISLFGDHLVSGEVPYDQWTNAEKNFANLQIPAHQMCSVNFE
jgi:hypothetical protein